MPDEPEIPDAAQPDPGYDSAGVPTFDSVREKIETRYGSALGSSELAAESRQGRDVEEQFEERERKAAERLAQIRESMRTDGPTSDDLGHRCRLSAPRLRSAGVTGDATAQAVALRRRRDLRGARAGAPTTTSARNLPV